MLNRHIQKALLCIAHALHVESELVLPSTIELGGRAFVLLCFLISRLEDPNQKTINAASTVVKVRLALWL